MRNVGWLWLLLLFLPARVLAESPSQPLIEPGVPPLPMPAGTQAWSQFLVGVGRMETGAASSLLHEDAAMRFHLTLPWPLLGVRPAFSADLGRSALTLLETGAPDRIVTRDHQRLMAGVSGERLGITLGMTHGEGLLGLPGVRVFPAALLRLGTRALHVRLGFFDGGLTGGAEPVHAGIGWRTLLGPVSVEGLSGLEVAETRGYTATGARVQFRWMVVTFQTRLGLDLTGAVHLGVGMAKVME